MASVDFGAQIPRLFVAAAVLAAFSCFSRPDYNLPLFIFATLAWTDKKVLLIN